MTNTGHTVGQEVSQHANDIVGRGPARLSQRRYDYKRVHMYSKPVRDADSNVTTAGEWHTTVSMPLDEYSALLALTPGEDTLMLSHYIRIEANRLR